MSSCCTPRATSIASGVIASMHGAPTAPVSGDLLVVMHVISHRHALPAAAADHEPLQQSRALSRGTSAPIGAPGERVTLHALEVRQILLPGDVAGMHVTQ